MRDQVSQMMIFATMLCAVAAWQPAGANTDQSKKNTSDSVIIVNGNTVTVVRNGRVQTHTVRRNATVAYHPPKPAPAPKNMPSVKGDAASCVRLVRDTSGYYDPPYYRAKNDCDRRVRLWVFDSDRKQWLDSAILESREDATSIEYEGMSVGENQVVAACSMSANTTPPGCFPKISGGLYAIASNNVILR